MLWLVAVTPAATLLEEQRLSYADSIKRRVTAAISVEWTSGSTVTIVSSRCTKAAIPGHTCCPYRGRLLRQAGSRFLYLTRQMSVNDFGCASYAIPFMIVCHKADSPILNKDIAKSS